MALEKLDLPTTLKKIGSFIILYCGQLKELNIPYGITTIGRWSFYNYASNKNLLKNIELPNSVTTIENGAFSWRTNLEQINIPEGVTSIEDEVFSGCKALKNITIPSSVKTMGAYVFSGDTITINVPFKEGEKPEGWDDNWNTGAECTINYAK